MHSRVISIFLCAGLDSRAREKDADLLDETPPKAIEHFEQGQCYQ